MKAYTLYKTLLALKVLLDSFFVLLLQIKRVIQLNL